MSQQREDKLSETNMELNQEFYGENNEMPEKASENKAENANININRLFNKEEDQDFDLQNEATITRGNG